MAFRVFLDSGVLIAAARGEHTLRECALTLLAEPNVEFWYSPLLKLEAMLQPAHEKRKAELAFMEEYFKAASCYGNLNDMYSIAWPDASKHGIPVVDALHVAAAHLARCSLLVTTEKPTMPMFRTKLVRVVSIRPLAEKQHTTSQHVRRLLGV